MTELSISKIKAFQDCLKQAEYYQQQGQTEQAIAQYKEAIKINPNSTTAYHNVGTIYVELQQWNEVINIYQKAIKINPSFDWGYYYLGDAYYHLKQSENAIIAYQQALDLNAQLPELYKKLANTFYQRANVGKTKLLDSCREKIAAEPHNIELYHQAISLAPKDTELYLGLGNALVRQQKIDEAIVTYQIALQIDPECQSAKVQLDKLQSRDSNSYQYSEKTVESSPEVRLQQAKQAVENLSKIALDNLLVSPTTINFPLSPQPTVSIILILYNRAELTLSCLQSLLQQSYTNYELIIIDNASSDRTKELLAKVKGAKITLNAENKHFLLAANQASQIATGDYLLFLNNDAQILGDSITNAVETISKNSNIGAVGGKIILPDGTLQEAGSIIWQDGSCLGYGRGDNPQSSQYMFAREVDYCSGAFLLTPRQLFYELGSFDTAYQPAYYEETDYCIKVHKAGKKIIYNPDVAILHYEFGSSEKSESAIDLQQRNQQVFIDKHRDWLQQQLVADLQNILPASNRNHKGERILFIDDRIPHPYLGSGYTRGHKILQIMSEIGYFITFYPTDLSYQENWQNAYQDIDRDIEIATGWGLQKLAEFLQTRPNYYDIIFVSRPHNMKHLNYIVSRDKTPIATTIIYDAEALYCLRDFAYQKLKGTELSVEEKQKAIADELELASKSNLIISVSPTEKKQFIEYGYDRVEVLGHSLEMKATPNTFEARQDILFVGSVYELNSPNADSILWFSREIFPLIQQQLGQQINLLLVGNNQVTELKEQIISLNNPQIKILGKIDNLWDVYNNSRIFIAPTRFAAGIPHKVHEASAYGLPVVTTTAIAMQLQWHNEVELLTGDKTSEFAESCIRLYRDSYLWQTIRENALKQIDKQCSPQYFKHKLQEILKINN